MVTILHNQEIKSLAALFGKPGTNVHVTNYLISTRVMRSIRGYISLILGLNEHHRLGADSYYYIHFAMALGHVAGGGRREQ
jgi:hypothetical protein